MSSPKDEVVCPTRTDMKQYWEVNAKVRSKILLPQQRLTHF